MQTPKRTLRILLKGRGRRKGDTLNDREGKMKAFDQTQRKKERGRIRNSGRKEKRDSQPKGGSKR